MSLPVGLSALAAALLGEGQMKGCVSSSPVEARPVSSTTMQRVRKSWAS